MLKFSSKTNFNEAPGLFSTYIVLKRVKCVMCEKYTDFD